MSRTSGRTAACSSMAPPTCCIHAHHHHRVPLVVGIFQGVPHLLAHRQAFELHEPLAADPDGPPVDVDRDAVADLVLGVVGHRQLEVQLLRLVENGQGNGVMELLLGGGGEEQDLFFGETVAGDDAADLGSFPGQGARLVEEDGIDLVHQLERPAVLDQDALAGTEGQRGEHGQRGGHPDPGAEIAVEHGHCAGRAHRRQADRADAQGRDHGLVGQAFALVLGAQLVACRIVEDLADLGRGRLAARFFDRDQDLAGHQQGRGEDPIAHPLLGGGRFAGQGVLIDHRQALGDDPVDGDDLAGVDDDGVSGLQPVERNLHLDAVAIKPDVPGLLAEGVQEQLLGIVLGLLDQDPPEAEAPAENRSRKDRHGPQAAQDHDRVQDVDSQPLLLDEHLASALEGGDRGVGEEPRGNRQEPRSGELRHGRKRHGNRAEGEMEVGFVLPRRMLGRGDGALDDLDDLVAGSAPWDHTGPEPSP